MSARTPATATITELTSTPITTAITSRDEPSEASNRYSFEMKPTKGGSPAIENEASTVAAAVSGNTRARPPRERSLVSWVAWITMPAQKNSVAL